MRLVHSVGMARSAGSYDATSLPHSKASHAAFYSNSCKSHSAFSTIPLLLPMGACHTKLSRVASSLVQRSVTPGTWLGILGYYTWTTLSVRKRHPAVTAHAPDHHGFRNNILRHTTSDPPSWQSVCSLHQSWHPRFSFRAWHSMICRSPLPTAINMELTQSPWDHCLHSLECRR
jgi:hypothetical protein